MSAGDTHCRWRAHGAAVPPGARRDRLVSARSPGVAYGSWVDGPRAGLDLLRASVVFVGALVTAVLDERAKVKAASEGEDPTEVTPAGSDYQGSAAPFACWKVPARGRQRIDACDQLCRRFSGVMSPVPPTMSVPLPRCSSTTESPRGARSTDKDLPIAFKAAFDAR